MYTTHEISIEGLQKGLCGENLHHEPYFMEMNGRLQLQSGQDFTQDISILFHSLSDSSTEWPYEIPSLKEELKEMVILSFPGYIAKYALKIRTDAVGMGSEWFDPLFRIEILTFSKSLIEKGREDIVTKLG